MALTHKDQYWAATAATAGGRDAAASTNNMPQGDTVARRFWSAVRMRGEGIALRQKELGLWREVSWRAFGEHARRVAMGLAALDFRPGDTAAILSNTRREWAYADWGVLSAGGVSVGIYPTASADEARHLMRDSGASVLFVENEEQLDKALQIRADCPALRKIVVFHMAGLHQFADSGVTSLEALEQEGANWEAEHPGELDQRLASRGPQDLSLLAYTSGTTGTPKGVMVSNANLTSVMDAYPIGQDERDDKVTYLPMCHIAERMMGSMLTVQHGGRMNFVENPETLMTNICEIAPTQLLGTPRVWEHIFSSMALRMKEATMFGRQAYALALGLAYRVGDLRLAGRQPGPALAIAHTLADLLVLGNLRRLMGLHRLRFALTSGAPISPNLIRWYRAIGVPLYEGWGMTETCGGGTMNTSSGVRITTVGRPISVNEMKLSGKGEVLVRGANVMMGYLNQPEKTSQAIDGQGWLHTGDAGEVDADGYYRIVGRMSDMVTTAAGTNVRPSEIENALKVSPYIADAVVVGDGKPYLSCLVIIDHGTVEHFAQEQSVPFSNFVSLCRAREVRELIQQEIGKVNVKLADMEQIKAFRLIEHKLTSGDEEFTATLQLKRNVVLRKYADLIEDMYPRGQNADALPQADTTALPYPKRA